MNLSEFQRGRTDSLWGGGSASGCQLVLKICTPDHTLISTSPNPAPGAARQAHAVTWTLIAHSGPQTRSAPDFWTTFRSCPRSLQPHGKSVFIFVHLWLKFLACLIRSGAPTYSYRMSPH